MLRSTIISAFAAKNGLKFSVSLCALFLSGFEIIKAQAVDTIGGVVTDSASGAPLSSVAISSGGVTAQTRPDGAFSLLLPTVDALIGLRSVSPRVAWDAGRDVFTWRGLSGSLSITVRNASGRVIARFTSARNSGEFRFSLTDLPAGIYAAAVREQNGVEVDAAYGFAIVNAKGGWGNLQGTSARDDRALGKAAATAKSHDLLFSKNGYAAKTVTVPAGTASGSPIQVKLSAGSDLAMESLQVSGAAAGATSKTNLETGSLYLLKAAGVLDVGGDKLDAEYGGFGNGGPAGQGPAGQGPGSDSVGGKDVGVDFGLKTVRVAKLVPLVPGRMKWFGGYRDDHTYYVIVEGGGKPLSLKVLTSSNSPATGNITVSIYGLTPAPPRIGAPIDTALVPVTLDSTWTHLTTAKGSVYLLQCDGQGHVGGAGLADGDADYMDYPADGSKRVDVGDANTDYGLGVDEPFTGRANTHTPRIRWWGNWRADHIYYMLFAGTGKRIEFNYYDTCCYQDNDPAYRLTIRMFAVP